MKKFVKFLQGIAIGLLLIALIAGNIAAYLFSDVIGVYLSGYDIDTSGVDFQQTAAIAERIEAEGLVLLKNEEIEKGVPSLPLQENVKKVNVFGWSSISPAYSGGGSGDSGSTEKAVTFYQGLENAGLMPNPALKTAYTNYYKERKSDNYWSKSYPYLNLIEPTAAELQSAVDMQEALAYSDTAIVFITRLGGEHQDLPKRQVKVNLPEDNTRTYLDISTEEEGLLDLIEATGFKNVIVIANSINTMNLDFTDRPSVKSALTVGAIGQYGANAIAKALTGEVNPSGKTVDTYAYDFSTAATYANSPDAQVVNTITAGVKKYTDANRYYIDYQEGIYVGYKWYETADAEGFWNTDFAKNKWGINNGYEDVVQYPFGYGLSYTEFNWNLLSVSPAPGSVITADTEIKVEVEVENVGSVPGMDVIELYYGAEYKKGGIEKSAKNLIGFQKTVELDPVSSEKEDAIRSTKFTISFKASDMASYDYNDANSNGHEGYELESGEYTIYLSKDVHTPVTLQNSQDSSVITYTVSNDINIDYVDGNEVYNRFTGNEASDNGVSSDGANVNQNIVYMTRNDFSGTFPQEHLTDRKQGFNATTDWNSFKDTDETYTQGAAGDLRLYDESGNPNLELIKELGKDYDSEKWTQLLNQMSADDLLNLFLYGGYQTKDIASIGKPLLRDLDGPMGLNGSVMTGKEYDFTFFPSETVLAQTWSEKLAYTYGLVIGYEASNSVSGWYAPACNLHRSPFGGRNFEYYSEDAFISGKMAANTIKGAANNGVYCYLKHFAVNETANIQSGASIGLYTWVTEQAMRENYLKAFEIAVKEGGANAVMNAYSCIGATWCGGSYALLQEVLREEWGFRGSVITDAWTPGNTEYVFDLGLRSGTNLILNSSNTLTAFSMLKDKTSTTALSCLRESAHNTLYTLCNTLYRQAEYLAAKDRGENPDGDMFAVEIGGKGVSGGFQTWIVLLVALDVVVVVLTSVWAYFAFFKKPLKKPTKKSSKKTVKKGTKKRVR